MKATRILFPLILAASLGCWADTLWTPSFDGYLNARSALSAGDIVYVQIDGATSLSFQAAASDAKSLTLEFSGGEFGNLFSFLPQTRSGGEMSSRGRQQYTLESRFAARVTQVDETGKARIQGTRNVTLEGKQESVALSGWLDPADLVSGREVRFSQLADSRLSFRTLLEPAAPVLTSRDIQRIVAALPPPAAAPAAAGAPPAPGAAPAAAPPGAAAPAAGYGSPAAGARAAEYTLTDARKVELFLRYVNRLIDFLFRQ
jgi:hypothetical protein